MSKDFDYHFGGEDMVAHSGDRDELLAQLNEAIELVREGKPAKDACFNFVVIRPAGESVEEGEAARCVAFGSGPDELTATMASQLLRLAFCMIREGGHGGDDAAALASMMLVEAFGPPPSEGSIH